MLIPISSANFLNSLDAKFVPLSVINAMGDSEPTSYPFEEIHSRRRCLIGDGYGLNPLGEFIGSHQEMSVSAVSGFREGTDHIESPLREWP